MLTRNQDIYRERVEEKRTLQAVANKYGVSRERIRQIVATIEAEENFLKTFPEVPVYVKDIPWTVRTYNCLRNENLTPMFLTEFVEFCAEFDLLRVPNLGKKCLREIRTKLDNHGYTLPDLEKEKKITLRQIREEKRKAKKQRNDLIVEYYLDFRKLDWISERLGVSKPTINQIIRSRLGNYRRRIPSNGN